MRKTTATRAKYQAKRLDGMAVDKDGWPIVQQIDAFPPPPPSRKEKNALAVGQSSLFRPLDSETGGSK